MPGLRLGLGHLRHGGVGLGARLDDLRFGLPQLLFGHGDLGLDLVRFHLLVGRIEQRDHIAFAHELVVLDHDAGDDTGDAGGNRVHVAGHVGIIRFNKIVTAPP